jgi:nucleotide-binding universal stress UspA family protein
MGEGKKPAGGRTAMPNGCGARLYSSVSPIGFRNQAGRVDDAHHTAAAGTDSREREVTMKQIHSILAPTGLSDTDLPALRYARLFADHFGAGLTVMYSDPVGHPVDFAAPADGYFITTTPEHREQLRVEVERQTAPIMDGRPVAIQIVTGQPAQTILSAAESGDVDLIVMGTHLRRGWRRAILGSVSNGVLHGARCPVLTVSGQDRYPAKEGGAVSHIVCPVNFTDVARESLRAAAFLADAFGAKLVVIHVIERDAVETANDHAETIRQWIDPELHAPVSYQPLIVEGGAADRVLDSAEELGADLLVIGAQHRIFRDATVIGTTTERLIRFSSCPVLVVPRSAPEAGEDLQRREE